MKKSRQRTSTPAQAKLALGIRGKSISAPILHIDSVAEDDEFDVEHQAPFGLDNKKNHLRSQQGLVSSTSSAQIPQSLDLDSRNHHASRQKDVSHIRLDKASCTAKEVSTRRKKDIFSMMFKKLFEGGNKDRHSTTQTERDGELRIGYMQDAQILICAKSKPTPSVPKATISKPVCDFDRALQSNAISSSATSEDFTDHLAHQNTERPGSCHIATVGGFGTACSPSLKSTKLKSINLENNKHSQETSDIDHTKAISRANPHRRSRSLEHLKVHPVEDKFIGGRSETIKYWRLSMENATRTPDVENVDKSAIPPLLRISPIKSSHVRSQASPIQRGAGTDDMDTRPANDSMPVINCLEERLLLLERIVLQNSCKVPSELPSNQLLGAKPGIRVLFSERKINQLSVASTHFALLNSVTTNETTQLPSDTIRDNDWRMPPPNSTSDSLSMQREKSHQKLKDMMNTERAVRKQLEQQVLGLQRQLESLQASLRAMIDGSFYAAKFNTHRIHIGPGCEISTFEQDDASEDGSLSFRNSLESSK